MRVRWPCLWNVPTLPSLPGLPTIGRTWIVLGPGPRAHQRASPAFSTFIPQLVQLAPLVRLRMEQLCSAVPEMDSALMTTTVSARGQRARTQGGCLMDMASHAAIRCTLLPWRRLVMVRTARQQAGPPCRAPPGRMPALRISTAKEPGTHAQGLLVDSSFWNPQSFLGSLHPQFVFPASGPVGDITTP